VLAFVVLGGFLFVITLYLQQVRGYSPLRAGLSLLPAMLVMAAAAPVAGQLTGRRGPRIPLVVSGLCIAAGMALLLGLDPGTSFTRLAIALAVIGAGLGLVNPPITNIGVSGMPPAQAGVASAVISATRQVGSVLGVAIMGDLVTTGVSSGMARGQTHAVALSDATHGAWAVAVGCGLVIALTGYLTTTARAHASAAAIAATPPAQPAEAVADR
jgi:MFS family permease